MAVPSVFWAVADNDQGRKRVLFKPGLDDGDVPIGALLLIAGVGRLHTGLGNQSVISDLGRSAKTAGCKQRQAGVVLPGYLSDEMTDALASKLGKDITKQFLGDTTSAMFGVDDEVVDSPTSFGFPCVVQGNKTEHHAVVAGHIYR